LASRFVFRRLRHAWFIRRMHNVCRTFEHVRGRCRSTTGFSTRSDQLWGESVSFPTRSLSGTRQSVAVRQADRLVVYWINWSVFFFFFFVCVCLCWLARRFEQAYVERPGTVDVSRSRAIWGVVLGCPRNAFPGTRHLWSAPRLMAQPAYWRSQRLCLLPTAQRWGTNRHRVTQWQTGSMWSWQRFEMGSWRQQDIAHCK